MSGIRVQQKLFSTAFRNFHRSAIFCENQTNQTLSNVSKNTEKQEKPAGATESILGRNLYKVTQRDKWLLVWHKKYKSINDVPSHVSEELIDQIQSKSRIRISNILMVLFMCAFGVTIFYGKKAMSEGDTIEKRISDRNKKLREDYLNEQKGIKSS